MPQPRCGGLFGIAFTFIGSDFEFFIHKIARLSMALKPIAAHVLPFFNSLRRQNSAMISPKFLQERVEECVCKSL